MADSPASSTISLTRASDTSFNSFTPGAHRRSHPNLHHMSFAPLTPKYPIAPSDYDAYIDPSTNTLHTSASLSQISSMPGAPGLLSVPTTPKGHRAHSHSRGAKSNVTLSHHPHRLPSGAVTSAGLGGKVLPPSSTSISFHRQSQSNLTDYPSWLIQTGLVLTDSSRESKGQTWLTKRASSTSLHSPNSGTTPRTGPEEYITPTREGARSARTTPAASRRSSRTRRSRRDLAMTQAIPGSPRTISHPPTAADGARKIRSFTEMQAQWTDPQSVAEQESLRSPHAGEVDDLNDNEDEVFEDAPVSVEEEREEEIEIQKQFREKGFVFGRWVDRVVDTLLMFEEDGDEDFSASTSQIGEDEGVVRGVRLTESSGDGESEEDGGKKSGERVEIRGVKVEGDALHDMEAAPENPESVWEDVKWFGRLVWGTPVV